MILLEVLAIILARMMILTILLPLMIINDCDIIIIYHPLPRIRTHAEVFGLLLRDKAPQLAARLVSSCILSTVYPDQTLGILIISLWVWPLFEGGVY